MAILAFLWLLLGALPDLISPASASAAQLRGAVLTPNFQWPAPVGVTAQQSDREIDAACALGSTVARVVMNWDALEPGPGQTDPLYAERIDRMIGGLARCGIRTELTILGTPCWDSTDPAVGSGCLNGTWRYPPRTTSSLGDIVAWSLARWGPSLAALEIWNEPNSTQFWLGTPQQYAALVNAAVDQAAAIGSTVPILAGALAGADVGYLNRLYAAGMRGQSGISIHPYTLRVGGDLAGFVNPNAAFANPAKARRARGSRSLFRASIGNVHQAMLAAGDRGGVWLTEFGYSVCPATPWCVPGSTQARWLADSFRAAATLDYVRAAIVFSLRDIGDSTDWNYRFGLLQRDFSARPSYRRLRQVFDALDRSSLRHGRRHRHRRH
jgi:hypothetical protein